MSLFFEKPLIFKAEEEKKVLVYGDFIIGDLTETEVEECITKIQLGSFQQTTIKKIVRFSEVFEYEFEKQNNYLMFSVQNADGKEYPTIDFFDNNETQKAEKEIIEKLCNFGFEREEKQLSPIQAAVTPGIVSAIVLAIGGFLTLFAYFTQDGPKRTMIVKWYVKLLYRITSVTGYIPFLIISIIVLLPCLYWLFKRVSNPPLQISAKKQLVPSA